MIIQESIEFKEAMFEFDMNMLQIEQMIISEEIMNHYNENFKIVNESVGESIQKAIVKIFTSIAEFLSKVIMNAKKTYMNINFSSAKKIMEDIRKSTNEPKDISFQLKIPAYDLVDPSKLDDLSKENVGFTMNNTSFTIDPNNEFVKGVKEYLSEKSNSNSKMFTKGFAAGFTLKVFGVENVKTKEEVDNCFKKMKEIEINKSNCRNMTGEVEKQLENVSNYMDSDLKKVIDKLSKLRSDSMKFSVFAKTHKAEFTFGINKEFSSADMTKLLRLTAVYYSTAVKFATQFIFKLMSFHISCLRENIMNMKKALL